MSEYVIHRSPAGCLDERKKKVEGKEKGRKGTIFLLLEKGKGETRKKRKRKKEGKEGV